MPDETLSSSKPEISSSKQSGDSRLKEIRENQNTRWQLRIPQSGCGHGQASRDIEYLLGLLDARPAVETQSRRCELADFLESGIKEQDGKTMAIHRSYVLKIIAYLRDGAVETSVLCASCGREVSDHSAGSNSRGAQGLVCPENQAEAACRSAPTIDAAVENPLSGEDLPNIPDDPRSLGATFFPPTYPAEKTSARKPYSLEDLDTHCDHGDDPAACAYCSEKATACQHNRMGAGCTLRWMARTVSGNDRYRCTECPETFEFAGSTAENGNEGK